LGGVMDFICVNAPDDRCLSENKTASAAPDGQDAVYGNCGH